MNDTSPKQTSRRWLLGTMAGGIVLILAFIFRDFVRQSIVLPILYVGWLGGLLLNSFDQSMLWIFLVILVVVFFLGMLFGNLRALPSTYIEKSVEKRSGRVAYWRREISMAHRVDFLYDSIYTRLARLLYEILASQYRLTPAEVEAGLKKGEIQVPDEVYAFLHRPSAPLPDRPRSPWARFLTFLDSHGIPVNSPRVDSQQDIDPQWEAIIRYLEDQMELTDEH